MALDVYVCRLDACLRTATVVRRVGAFEAEEGAYWFFYPYFERLAGENGSMIDLYDTVDFTGAALDALEHTLQKVSASLAARPDHWDEVTGWRMSPERHEIQQWCKRPHSCDGWKA